VNALGLEGISVEWVIMSLKPGGKAFLVIPDGILGRADKKLRTHILQQCHLDAIVSLPVRTFFANGEHTYILAITKKHRPEDNQTAPVFTYLASNIGEKLTSIKREAIEADDLPEMERLFRFFMADRSGSKSLEKFSGRCKVVDIDHFRTTQHWVIDRWWSRQELIAVGAEEVTSSASAEEVEGLVAGFKAAVAAYNEFLSADPLKQTLTKEVPLSDGSLFRLFIGKRVLVPDLSTDERLIPLYSANAVEPMGYLEESNVSDFGYPSILWSIDNSLFNYNLIPAGKPFATTDHCGTLQILNPAIVPEYLLHALHVRRTEKSFDRAFRASLTNMRELTVPIPIRKDGSFDVTAQKKIAARFTAVIEKREELEEAKRKLDETFARYLATPHL
jgi:type I restriction enzyme M protein